MVGVERLRGFWMGCEFGGNFFLLGIILSFLMMKGFGEIL